MKQTYGNQTILYGPEYVIYVRLDGIVELLRNCDESEVADYLNDRDDRYTMPQYMLSGCGFVRFYKEAMLRQVGSADEQLDFFITYAKEKLGVTDDNYRIVKQTRIYEASAGVSDSDWTFVTDLYEEQNILKAAEKLLAAV